jgi:hypothetical protein
LGVKGAKAVSETASTLTNEADAISSLATKYDDFLGMTARQSKIEERYAKDTPKFLAEEFRGELPLSVSNGTRDLTEAKEFVRNKYQAEANAFNTVLKDSGVYGSIDDMAKEAKRLARQEFSGTDLEKALNSIDQEANAFRAQYAADAVYDETGKQLIPIHQIDEIKKYQWGRVKRGFNSPDGALLDDTDFLLGKAAQGQIESKVSEAPIKRWNKRLGDFASAMKILDSRDKLAVKNRYLNRITGRLVGLATGGTLAGPLGAIPATITGDWLALQLSNPEVNTYFIKQALKRIPASRRAGIVEEAQQILNSFEAQRASRLRLPAPSPLGSSRNPIITPAPTTYEAPAQRVMNQSMVKPATVAQTANKTSVSSLDLSKEAAKYKTAEEFVNSHKTVFRGEGKNTGRKNMLEFGQGKYITTNKEYASNYGDVKDMLLSPSARIINAEAPATPDVIKIIRDNVGKTNTVDSLFTENKNPTFRELWKRATELGDSPEMFNEALKKAGYDGIEFSAGRILGRKEVPSFSIWNNDKILTKSQLTDIWNEANKR